MNEKETLNPGYKPPKRKWFLLSVQHVFAMFSATVLVPMLTGLPISVALFASGVGTLIYILCTKGKVPIYLGSSFAYIAYICVAAGVIKNDAGVIISADLYGPAFTGIILVGLIYCIVAGIIKVFGIGWLIKLLPPVVVGPMIMVIGLSLAGSAIGNTGMVENGDWRAIIVSLSTMLIIAFLAIKAKGFLKVVPFLMGIIGGFIIAEIFDRIPNGSHNLVANMKFIDVLKNPSEWFSLPKFAILGWKDAELGAGISMYQINFSAAISVIPLAFATICEHIGDHHVLGSITGKNYLKDPGLHRTLLGDGLATMFAGFIGGPANTSYGENTSVVGMTKIGSVWVTGGAAVIAILLSFCNLFTTLISIIPASVMGGVCLILYGFIASNGLKILFDKKINLGVTRNLVIISVMLIVGIGGAIIPLYGVAKITPVALSAILGLLLNVILPKEKNETE